jgi:hypothetical protein
VRSDPLAPPSPRSTPPNAGPTRVAGPAVVRSRVVSSYPAERTLDPAHVAAIRSTREALFDAAREGDPAAIERTLARFVHAMWAADFTRQTIASLVAAAVDAGLPAVRGAARRAKRAQSLAAWTRLGERVADVLAHRVTKVGGRGGGTVMALLLGAALELATSF